MATRTLNNEHLLDQWICGIATDDRDAMEKLYHETSAAVYAYSLSILKNVHDAEDVLQECFISIHASAGSYRSNGKPMAWIITIAKNLCLMRLRQQKNSVELPLDDWKDYLEHNEEMTTMDRILVSECIGKDAAKTAALTHAGVTADSITGYECELDVDFGKAHHEIEFEANGMDYEYEIDATTGTILKADKEKDD